MQQTETARGKVTDDLGAIDLRRKKIDEMVKDIDDAQREANDLQAEVRVELRVAERHHGTWKNTHEPKLRQVETELDTLQAIERIRRFEEQAVDIQERIDHIKATEKDRDQEHILSTTPLTDEERPTTYQKKKLELATLQGQVEQAAIRIGFDSRPRMRRSCGSRVEYLAEDEEYLVSRADDVHGQRPWNSPRAGGGSSLEDLQMKTQSLSADVASLFERFGVTEEQELYDLQQRRQELEP